MIHPLRSLTDILNVSYNRHGNYIHFTPFDINFNNNYIYMYTTLLIQFNDLINMIFLEFMKYEM